MDEAHRTAKAWNDPPPMEEMAITTATKPTNHISGIRKYRYPQQNYATSQPGINSSGNSVVSTTFEPQITGITPATASSIPSVYNQNQCYPQQHH